MTQVITIQIAGASPAQCDQVKGQVTDIVKGVGFKTTVEEFVPETVADIAEGEALIQTFQS